MFQDLEIIGHMAILNTVHSINQLLKKKLEKLQKSVIHFNVFFYYILLVEVLDQALEHIF